jgi:hypothetical protein
MVVLVVALLPACGDEHHGTGSGGPAAPTDFMVSNVGGGAHLTWTDVADDEDHYMVMRKPTDGAYDVVATLPFNAIQYHDSAITAGTTYVYQVIAMNARGQGASDESTFTP